MMSDFKSYDLSPQCGIHSWTCDDFTISRTDDQMLLESEIATYLFRNREVPDLPGAVK